MQIIDTIDMQGAMTANTIVIANSIDFNRQPYNLFRIDYGD